MLKLGKVAGQFYSGWGRFRVVVQVALVDIDIIYNLSHVGVRCTIWQSSLI